MRKGLFIIILYSFSLAGLAAKPLVLKPAYDYSEEQLMQKLAVAKTAEEKLQWLHGLIMNDNNDATIDSVFILQLLQVNETVKLLPAAPYQKLLVASRSQHTLPVIQTLALLKEAIEAFDKENIEVCGKLLQTRHFFNAINNQEEKRHYHEQKLTAYLALKKYLNAAACYHALGGYYIFKGDYNAIINHYLKAAELFQPYSEYFYVVELVNVGNQYNEWGNSKKGLSYLQKGLKIELRNRKKNKNDNIGFTYHSLAEVAYKLKNYKRSLAYLIKSETIIREKSKQKKHSTDIGTSILYLRGLNYLELKSYSLALLNFQKAQENAQIKKIAFTTSFGQLELNYGFYKYYKALKNIPKAETYLLNAYQEAENSSLDRLKAKYLEELVSFYGQKNDPQSAWRYFIKYQQEKDSLAVRQNSFKVATYETELKEKAQQNKIRLMQQQQAIQTATLKQRNLIVRLSLAGFLAVVGFLIFIYRQLQINKQTLSTLRQTQTQLIQSEKMASLGELTAGIAHEIQNPLNFVNNFSEVSAELLEELKEELHNGDTTEALSIAGDLSQNLTKITHHGKRADGIVKGMLQHSRNTSGKKELTDINALAEEYLGISYHGMRAKDKAFNVELITHFDQKLPLLKIIPQEIGRVFINLFTNAFYAVQQKQKSAGAEFKPTIEICTYIIAGGVNISVRDNGNGIPNGIKDKILQPFFTTKPTGEGTGLGLSLSYDIVTKGHNGKLEMHTQEGEFAEFKVTLPLSGNN